MARFSFVDETKGRNTVLVDVGEGNTTVLRSGDAAPVLDADLVSGDTIDVVHAVAVALAVVQRLAGSSTERELGLGDVLLVVILCNKRPQYAHV
jgi:hypothetical protein